MNLLLSVIAQTQTPQTPPSGTSGLPLLFPALLMALVVYMLLSSRSQKKREQRERDEMHARLARNDRVLTIGGVIGTVLSVKDNDVVLKVDESTNTKMTFIKTAIQRVLTDDQPAGGDKKR